MARPAKTKSTNAKAGAPLLRLQRSLLRLAATRTGFEGLTAALVATASQGSVRLMSSGDQQGVDAIGLIAGAGPRRAMQSKRYKPTSSLDLNGLLGEMTRADDHFRTIDCWVLATTKAVLGKEAEALGRHADSLGWKLIVLDWSEDGRAIPRLAVLCAAYPEVTTACAGLTRTGADLAAIATMPGFAAVRDELIAELRAADAGFDAARAAAALRLQSIFENAPTARAIAGASPALLASAPPIDRPAITGLVRDWSETGPQVLALLGREGNGKTWAALQGLAQLQENPEAPLALILSSGRAAKQANGFDALVSELTQLGQSAGLRLRDPDSFWRRRAETWALPGEGRAPRIALLIDGLDEIDGRDWDEWLAPLLVPGLAPLVRLLLTCREDDWERRIALRDLDASQLEVHPIGKFTPPERDAYLSARGVDITDVSPEVLAEALHPRTAFHVTRLAAELPDLKRLTREQLLLRDFLNRSEIRQSPLRPEEFQALVAALARQAQDAALSQAAFAKTEAEVVGTAADVSTHSKAEMRRVLSDLVSSRWFHRTDDEQGEIEFADEALPDAVGLALAADLKRLPPDEVGRQIDRFLEPWGADDLIEGVLRMTATALITDAHVPDDVCTVVLERWFARTFHGRPGQDFWRRLHVVRPAVFLDFAEREDRYRHEWLLEWAIACLWEDHEAARPVVEKRIKEWLRCLALPAEHHNADPIILKIQNGPRNRQLRRSDILLAKGEQNLASRLTQENDRDFVMLAARVIGFLPRVPFFGPIAEWALNVAASARVDTGEAMAALIRENEEDHDEAVKLLREKATKWLAADARLLRRAGAVLLDLTGLAEDAALAQPWRRSTVGRAVEPRLALQQDGTVEATLELSGKPEFLIRSLVAYAGRPDVRLSPKLGEDLEQSVASLSPADAPDWLQNELAQLSVLARWQGPRTIELLQAYLSVLPGTVPAERHARDDFRHVGLSALPVLPDKARSKLADHLFELAEPDGEGRGAALLVALARAPLRHQIELLLASPIETWPADRRHVLAHASPDDLLALLRSIDGGAPIETLLPQIMLSQEIAVRLELSEAVPVDWLALFGRADPKLVGATIRLGLDLHSVDAARALARSGIQLSALDNSDPFYASELLAKLEDEEVEPLLGHLETESLLRLFGDRPSLRNRINPLLMRWVEDSLMTKRTSWSLGGSYFDYPKRQGYFDVLVAENAAEVETMMRNAWTDTSLRSNIRYDHGEGPAWLLLASLMAYDPDFVSSIWTETVNGSANMWIGMIEHWPAALPPGSEADAMRRAMLARPKSDEKLFHAVMALQKAGHGDLIIREAERLSWSNRAVDRARALAIAGFMEPNSEADALWRRLEAMPTSPWLEHVGFAARRWHEDGIALRHWAGRAVNEQDELAAWAAAIAMMRVYDGRCSYLYRAEGFKVDPYSWRGNWLDLLVPTRRAIRERRLKELEKSKNLAARTDRIIHQAG